MQSLNRAGIIASLAFIPGSDPLGTVEGQAKQSGTTVPYHSHMQINISSGPGDKPKEQVPNVIGQPLQQALSSINGAHLRLLYLKFPVTLAQPGGEDRPAVTARRRAGTAKRAGGRVPRRVLGLSYQPRRSSSSLGSSDCVEMPTIASPRPAETRATTSASR